MGSFEKGDRGARILKVQTLLQGNPRGLTPAELARRTGVAARTTYRDIRALEAMNVPIYDEGGRILIDPNYFMAPVKFTLGEAMALLIGARLWSRYTDEADQDAADAFSKLAAVLPVPVAEYVQATVAQMLKRPANPSHARTVQTLALAWAGRRVARIWYRVADTDSPPRLIEPYFLEPSQIGHSLYVVARDRGVGEMRTFKVERIARAELMADTYQIPPDFDINAYLSKAWGIFHSGQPVEVRLRFFSPAAARVKESTWHPSQRLQVQPDGSLEMRVTVAGTIEITSWILSWGETVEVLDPPDLRARIAEIGRAMADRHDRAAIARPANGPPVGARPGVGPRRRQASPR